MGKARLYGLLKKQNEARTLWCGLCLSWGERGVLLKFLIVVDLYEQLFSRFEQ